MILFCSDGSSLICWSHATAELGDLGKHVDGYKKTQQKMRTNHKSTIARLEALFQTAKPRQTELVAFAKDCSVARLRYLKDHKDLGPTFPAVLK